MSKPSANPFFEIDFSKFMDMSKMMGDFKMPGLNMEAMMAAHRRNVEAMTAANQMAIESMQLLARRQAELMRQNFEASTSLVQALMSSPSPEEKVAKQAQATKATMERCMNNMREMTDAVTRNQYQAMEVVSNRLCESMDELQNIIKQPTRAA